MKDRTERRGYSKEESLPETNEHTRNENGNTSQTQCRNSRRRERRGYSTDGHNPQAHERDRNEDGNRKRERRGYSNDGHNTQAHERDRSEDGNRRRERRGYSSDGHNPQAHERDRSEDENRRRERRGYSNDGHNPQANGHNRNEDGNRRRERRGYSNDGHNPQANGRDKNEDGNRKRERRGYSNEGYIPEANGRDRNENEKTKKAMSTSILKTGREVDSNEAENIREANGHVRNEDWNTRGAKGRSGRRTGREGYSNEGYVPETDRHMESETEGRHQARSGDSHTSLSEEDEKGEEGMEVEQGEEDDPWALPELKDNQTPWAELTSKERVLRVVWYIFRFVSLATLLYMFICSLDILSSAFRLLGGKAAGEALSNTFLFSNPIAGVMLGVLATLLVQSSSTSTSIVVSMVSAGLLPVYSAIPMVMGSNIGTTVTNTIVAVSQSANRGDFRRAFAAATVHDMFNWLSVLVFLPLEWATRYLYHLTNLFVQNLGDAQSSGDNPEFLKAITTPLTGRIVQLSSEKIKEIAKGNDINGSLMTGDDHLFSGWSGSDAAAGGILLAASLVVLCTCLVLIVKLLTSLLKGTIAKILQRFINSDLPGPAKYLTGYLAILIGAGMTILVQSSSIFTSAITPLVGIGAIHIERMYPLTLGSNIGTTVTGILAALASDSTGFKNSLQVALCHLFFNISGILLWFPVPFMRRIPINLAKGMGETVSKYRWFAFVYLILFYFLLPVTIFGLSLAGWVVLLQIGLPIVILIIVVVIINILQNKKPEVLHPMLRSWEKLGVPEFLRSLEPCDRLIVRMRSRLRAFCGKDDPDSGTETAEKEKEREKDIEVGQSQRRTGGTMKAQYDKHGRIVTISF